LGTAASGTSCGIWGGSGRLLGKLARMDVLLLDDWALAPVQDQERRDHAYSDNRAARGSGIDLE